MIAEEGSGVDLALKKRSHERGNFHLPMGILECS